jgi:chromosome segregation ATPase
MDSIINALTGNVNSNDDLVEKVLQRISALTSERNQLATTSGSSVSEIEKLNEKIKDLQNELASYKQRIQDANVKLQSTVDKLVQATGGGGDEDSKKNRDGRRHRRSRKSRSRRRRKTKKSSKRRKSKRRYH